MSSSPKPSKHSRLKKTIVDSLNSRFSGEISLKSDEIADVVLKAIGVEEPKPRTKGPQLKQVSDAKKEELRKLWKANREILPVGIFFTRRQEKVYVTLEWKQTTEDVVGWYRILDGIVSKVFPSALMTSGGGWRTGRATFRIN